MALEHFWWFIFLHNFYQIWFLNWFTQQHNTYHHCNNRHFCFFRTIEVFGLSNVWAYRNRNFVKNEPQQKPVAQVRTGQPRDKVEDDDKRSPPASSTETASVASTTQFSYPAAWRDSVPKFPFVPLKDEVTSATDTENTTTSTSMSATTLTTTATTTLTTLTTKAYLITETPETKWKMPVFPFDKSSIDKRYLNTISIRNIHISVNHIYFKG